MTTLSWCRNHPRQFWQIQPDLPEEVWQRAIYGAFPILELPLERPDAETILDLTLGEGRFGPDHWRLSFPKRAYYVLKPLLPRALTRLLRRAYRRSEPKGPEIRWPIDPRYVAFVWDVLARVLKASPNKELIVKSLWPDGYRFAFVLTHDVEAKTGLEYVGTVADLEESLGFRSSFNFVPEGYPIDVELLNELRRRGFEVGLHGLKHDGRLFDSPRGFERSAVKINNYLRSIKAVGFRSPLTLRNPEWLQSLDIAYDLSFFDTDPFEPIPGGTMSIWPFFMGRFVELPYTLVQDYTLTDILKEGTPRLWLEKVEFVSAYCGMALVNTHPDYLSAPYRLNIYTEFLKAMREKQEYWHALPYEVARWWNDRPGSNHTSTVTLNQAGICLSTHGPSGKLLTYEIPIGRAITAEPSDRPF